MKLNRSLKTFAVLLTCTGLLAGQAVQAASPIIRDVALQPGGTLRGQVLNEQAVAQGQSKIAVVYQGKPLTVIETDRDGHFVLSGLEPGMYELHLAEGGGAYRVWAPRTAPPSAQDSVLLVENGQVVRGALFGGGPQGGGLSNGGGAGCLGWLANPWVLGTIVALAIALPLALDDNDAS